MKKEPVFATLVLLSVMTSPTIMATPWHSNTKVGPESIVTKTSSKQNYVNAKTVKGTVVDENGIPIIGANIVVAGTTHGTVTDIDGNFTLEGVNNGDKLTISYIGYIEQSLVVNQNSEYKIVLKEDSQSLDEVVVVGYGTQKKVNLTGAVAAIGADEIIKPR